GLNAKPLQGSGISTMKFVRIAVVFLVGACGYHAPDHATADGATPVIDAAPDGQDAAADAVPDAVPVAVVIEAEDFAAKSDSPTRAWTATTTVGGFSGASYMQCGPGNGAFCP